MTLFLEYYIQALSELASRKRKLTGGECQTPAGQRCTLCSAVDFTYEQELIAKANALNAFWKKVDLRESVEPLIPSPLGREYRTVSKRKAFRIDGKVRLALMDLEDSHTPPFRPLDIETCPIEPAEHGAIYQAIQKFLEKQFAAAAAAALNYVIIKGTYAEHLLIFSLSTHNPGVSKAISRFAKLLTEACETVTSFYLFIDEGGAYSPLMNPEEHQHRFKRLVGKKEITQTLHGRTYVYSGLAFSQTNMSIYEPMLDIIIQLIHPERGDKLYHLYCGNAAYSIEMVDRVAQIIGIDPSPSAIEAAKANMIKQHLMTCRFVRSEIHEMSLKKMFKGTAGNEIVLYMPPRKASTRAVIEFLGSRKVRSIVHVFHDIDAIAGDLQRWQKKGYKPKRIIPFDVVPGLAAIETVVLLERS